jgi:hypothetical protein
MKDKYLQNCLEMRKDFTPMVYSVDGIAGHEARNAEKRLATHLAGKWNREYSQMVYYVRVRMAITVVHDSSFVAAVIDNDPDAPSSPTGPP